MWLCYDLYDIPCITNKKCTWHDLIKEGVGKNLSLYFLQVSAKLSWILKCTVPFSLPFYETTLTLTSQPGLLLPAPCSTLPSLFPSTQCGNACFAMTVSRPRANWRPFIQTQNKNTSPSDKLTLWLMKPCMGERDARGCRWILTWNISWQYQYHGGSQKVPTHNNTYSM